MAESYLVVPFAEKATVKALGARWNPEARQWFVPAGRDLAPFAAWLPRAAAAGTPPGDIADPTKGVPLSRLLAGVAQAVEQAFSAGIWTVAEIVKVSAARHVRLELAERDANGQLVAKAQGVIWERTAMRILPDFEAATGVRLDAGIKVLLRARPDFHPQYGLSLDVDAIDAAYTLGDLEARKRDIRERLKREGVFDQNRALPAPWDYRTLLVVSPPRAAGLGDFAKEADRLQRHGICQAVYTHSRFEGEGAPALIRNALHEALASWSEAQLPDAIVVIRGGGAVNDLAWLNDYELARFICDCPIPVLTGIGHERDSTLLDEVAQQRFDTPSKAIAGIQAQIVHRSREAQTRFDEVAGRAARQLQQQRVEIGRLDGQVRSRAMSAIGRSRATAERLSGEVERGAVRALHAASLASTAAIGAVRSSAGIQLAGAGERAPVLLAQVRGSAEAALATARRRTERASASVVAAAAADVERVRQQAAHSMADLGRMARQGVVTARAVADAAVREVVAQGPSKTLGRGFAVVRSTAGETITSASGAAQVAKIEVEFSDGRVRATVRENPKQ